MSVFRTKQLVERELAREEQPQDHDTYDDGADDEEEDADVAADEEEGADFGLPRARGRREEPVDFLKEFRKMLDENIYNFYQTVEEMEWRFSLFIRFRTRFIHPSSRIKFSWNDVGKILKRPHEYLRKICYDEMKRIRNQLGEGVVIDLLEDY